MLGVVSGISSIKTNSCCCLTSCFVSKSSFSQQVNYIFLVRVHRSLNVLSNSQYLIPTVSPVSLLVIDSWVIGLYMYKYIYIYTLHMRMYIYNYIIYIMYISIGLHQILGFFETPVCKLKMIHPVHIRTGCENRLTTGELKLTFLWACRCFTFRFGLFHMHLYVSQIHVETCPPQKRLVNTFFC